MKKIFSSIDRMVVEMGSGLALTYPGKLAFDYESMFVVRASLNADKVTLISGGGSGHEPAHGGFVGKGMLDAAVCGEIFSSPSQIQVYRCIKATAGKKGTLLIIKNYSGDIMNFQNAAALAELDGLKVDYVKVADDIAVEDSLYTVGRRGVAGTVFVHKVAGAAAEAGKNLAEVKRIAQKCADNVRSVGFAYTSCTVPAKGSPTFDLGPDEMEYGVGIHGEPGVKREPITTADALAERMVRSIGKDLGIRKGDTVALMVNGFGGTPLLELDILNHFAMKEVAGLGINVARNFTGNYMTSIDMAGASISLLRLDEELEKYLTAVSEAPAFRVDGTEQKPRFVEIPDDQGESQKEFTFTADASGGANRIQNNRLTPRNMVYIIDKMAEIIIENEVPFCDLDSHAGDGDFGKSVANGFKQLKRNWGKLQDAGTKGIYEFLDACSLIIMQYCGGASGPIWGFAFKHAALSAKGKDSLSVQDMADLLAAAVYGIQDVGERAFGRGAGIGDKTLMDALIPCAESWKHDAGAQTSMLEAFSNGAAKAVEGAESTKNIVARMGRAGTVGERSIGYPDTGAFALGKIFTDIASSLTDK
ncbi:MAG: dihydroxyacetone kinase subunit DhaK [Planctomycetaceae bacterium]|nr:dihydroxyacetone kinase subunit DhaK [Planctomycetaceae bacterium]